MKRITISLPDDLAAIVGREAGRRRTTTSELARAALAREVGLAADGPRALPFAAVGRSGRRTVARDMEELLAQEWNGRSRRR
jgi:hypothetical protein